MWCVIVIILVWLYAVMLYTCRWKDGLCREACSYMSWHVYVCTEVSMLLLIRRKYTLGVTLDQNVAIYWYHFNAIYHSYVISLLLYIIRSTSWRHRIKIATSHFNNIVTVMCHEMNKVRSNSFHFWSNFPYSDYRVSRTYFHVSTYFQVSGEVC